MTAMRAVTVVSPRRPSGISGCEPQILQIPPNQAVLEIDDADRGLADAALRAGKGPLPDHDHRVALRDQPLDFEADVRRPRHRLAAEQDEGLASQDRLRYAGGPMHDVGMQSAGGRPHPPPR